MTKIDTSQSYNQEQLPLGSKITIRAIRNGKVEDEVVNEGTYKPGLLVDGELIEAPEEEETDVPALEVKADG